MEASPGCAVPAGTPQHVPPEYNFRGRYRAGPTTVWQLGVVLYEMLHNEDFSTIPFLLNNLIIDEDLSDGRTQRPPPFLNFTERPISASRHRLFFFSRVFRFLGQVFGDLPQAANEARGHAVSPVVQRKHQHLLQLLNFQEPIELLLKTQSQHLCISCCDLVRY